MKNSDIILFLVVAAINAGAGIVGAIFISRLLVRLKEMAQKKILYFLLFLGVYLLECIAFPAGMATQVFSVILAFVWGLVFGLWLRYKHPFRLVLKFSLWLSLYTCIPTLSFSMTLPVMTTIDGRNILTSEAGYAFGIPAFLPWPIDTILGFCITLAVATVILKTAITVGGVHLLHRRESEFTARRRERKSRK